MSRLGRQDKDLVGDRPVTLPPGVIVPYGGTAAYGRELAGVHSLRTLGDEAGARDALLAPTIGALRAVPSLAWVPLLILYLQYGEDSKVTLVAIGLFAMKIPPACNASRYWPALTRTEVLLSPNRSYARPPRSEMSL